jgi:putative ABC transport system permease protein
VYVSEAVRSSLAEILAHKLRSGLTLVGIVLGTTALVVMVSVIGGLAVSVQQGLTDLGFDGVIFVVPQKTQDRLEQKKEGYSRGLRSADAKVIEPGKQVIGEAAPMLSLGDETARLNGRTLKVAVEGVTPAWGRIRNRVPAEGRYLAERDIETRATVALIGHKLKQDAFGNEEALGREIVIRGVRFRVVGVLKHLGTDQVNDDEMERDNAKVYVPLTTAQQYFAGTDAVHAWAFQADPDDLENAQKEAEALMRRSHRGITDFKVQNIGEEILRVRKEVDVLIANWRVVLASIAFDGEDGFLTCFLTGFLGFWGNGSSYAEKLAFAAGAVIISTPRNVPSPTRTSAATVNLFCMKSLSPKMPRHLSRRTIAAGWGLGNGLARHKSVTSGAAQVRLKAGVSLIIH